ncbi:MAG: hypothetical protein O7C75_07255 [Verrucomicrobia bacterium]|nr:hypothetical protein [Verrucomicrobiota bacterium]
MNKNLLLIICDFLLLSLLALVRFETPDENQPVQEVLPEDPIQAQEDIIEVLKLSLELEEESNHNMAASLQQTQQTLETTEENLQNREEELELTRAEREALAKNNDQLESDLQERIAVLEKSQQDVEQMNAALEEQRREAERKLRQMEDLQKELRDKQAAIASAETRQKELEDAQRQAEQKTRILDTQLQLAEAESRLVRENLEQARSEIAIVRDDNIRLQEHASQLATELTEGVNAQTERLTEIAEQVRQSQPRSPNLIFSDFVGSGVTIDVRYQKSTRRGGDEKLVTVRPVVVSDGKDLKAVFTWEDFGLSENDLRNENLNLRGVIRLGRYAYPLKTLDFLSIDARVLTIPLESEWVNIVETEPFYVALDPLKFPRAVLIDRQNGFYGEAPFKLELKTPKHFRIDSRFMNRLMGEFSPRESNIMFSKTGDFLGVMINKEYAARIDNFVSAETVTLGETDTLQQLQKGYTRMINQVRRLPSGVR